MYVPSLYAESRPETLFEFIDAHPLAMLVTASADGLFATHLPLICDRSRGPHGTLEGHIARANPQHRQVLTTAEALVVFAGPDAYVTPEWYATKREHGKVVPTWNYVAVHAYGTPRFIDDPEFLRRNVTALTTRHESGRERPWSVGDAPAEYIEQQLRAIVGLELTITRLEGKWKMSQNRPSADIDGVVRGLEASPSAGDRAVGEIVAERRPPGRG